MADFMGADVNAVLRLVKSLTDNGDAQLSILTMALVTACASCGLEKADAMPAIQDAWDDMRPLVLLDSPEATGS